MALRSQVHQLFVDSRSSAGSRSIMGMMREQGSAIGRFKVGRLMTELGLICKQPGNHAYKQATVERVDIPNRLNRQFDVEAPNRVWCGDITFMGARTLALSRGGAGPVYTPDRWLGLLHSPGR